MISGIRESINAGTSLKPGETQQRPNVVPAWRDVPFFSEAEKAALALAEQVTFIAQRGVSDAVFEDARKHFGDAGLVHLLMAISTIGAWNRQAIATRIEPRERAA